MKKRILSLALLLMIGFTSTFANKVEEVNSKAVNAFKRDFAEAKDVKWESGKTYAKATFQLNGQVMFAYYNVSGEMMAITRNIVSSQLPISLFNELKQDYAQYWISDLFEMVSGNETNYYVTIENADAVIVLKSTDGTHWDLFRRERKA